MCMGKSMCLHVRSVAILATAACWVVAVPASAVHVCVAGGCYMLSIMEGCDISEACMLIGHAHGRALRLIIGRREQHSAAFAQTSPVLRRKGPSIRGCFATYLNSMALTRSVGTSRHITASGCWTN